MAVGAAGRFETKLGHILQAAVEGEDHALGLLRGGDRGHYLPLHEHLARAVARRASSG